jgi:hypothetical protein
MNSLVTLCQNDIKTTDAVNLSMTAARSKTEVPDYDIAYIITRKHSVNSLFTTTNKVLVGSTFKYIMADCNLIENICRETPWMVFPELKDGEQILIVLINKNIFPHALTTYHNYMNFWEIAADNKLNISALANDPRYSAWLSFMKFDVDAEWKTQSHLLEYYYKLDSGNRFSEKAQKEQIEFAMKTSAERREIRREIVRTNYAKLIEQKGKLTSSQEDRFAEIKADWAKHDKNIKEWKGDEYDEKAFNKFMNNEYFTFYKATYDANKQVLTRDQILDLVKMKLPENHLTMFIDTLMRDVNYIPMIYNDMNLIKTLMKYISRDRYTQTTTIYMGLRFLYCMELYTTRSKRDIADEIILDSQIVKLLESNYNYTYDLDVSIKNQYGITPDYMCVDTNQYGIFPLSDIKRHIAGYTQDVFEDILSDEVVLCGSAIPACTTKPFKKYADKNINKFWEEFYPSLDSVDIQATLKKDNGEVSSSDSGSSSDIDWCDQEDDFDITGLSSKLASTTVDKQLTVEDLRALYEKISDIDIAVQASSEEDFLMKANSIFEKIKANVTKRGVKTYCDITSEKKCGAAGKAHRFIIFGLRRKIDLFLAWNVPKTVSNFHLACVRAFYNGSKLSVFPSFITAAYNRKNVDLKWISCNKDAQQVILRYHQRGFGTTINKSEVGVLQAYADTHDQWLSFDTPNQYQSLYYNKPDFWNPVKTSSGVRYGLVANKFFDR